MIVETAQTARARLLDAAEALFGERGLQASIREITAAASANLAAINYHFGSKESLIAAVLERRAAPVNEDRLRLLTQFEEEAGSEAVAVEKVLYAFLAPALDLLRQHPQALKFVYRLLSDPDPRVRGVMAVRFGEVARRFHGALRKALPHLSPQEVSLRLTCFIGSMIHTWVHCQDIPFFLGKPAEAPDSQRILDTIIRYSAAGMKS
jgi:AcrR family transcriptional regulator